MQVEVENKFNVRKPTSKWRNRSRRVVCHRASPLAEDDRPIAALAYATRSISIWGAEVTARSTEEWRLCDMGAGWYPSKWKTLISSARKMKRWTWRRILEISTWAEGVKSFLLQGGNEICRGIPRKWWVTFIMTRSMRFQRALVNRICRGAGAYIR